MQGLAGDLRAAFRLLRKDLGFSATTILTLAVCLGANIATFTVVYSVLLRPLPVPNANRIVALGDVYPTVTPNDIVSNTVPAYFDRLEALTAFESQAMFTYWFDTLAIDGNAQELRGMRATPSLFRVLQVQPALGRTFTDAEGEVGSERKIILSHGLWQRLSGGDPAAVGKDAASRLDGPALYDRRRHATWLLVLPDGQRRPRAERRRRDPVLAAPRVHRRTAIRRRPHAVWLLSHRTARAGGNDRAGARAGRRVERAHVRAVSAVPLHRAPHVHGRHAAPGSTHRHGPARPVSALGRRRVRAADWRAQHREPLARTRQRASAGAGDAYGARRRPASHHAAADRRRRAARGRGRPCRSRRGRGPSSRARIGRPSPPPECVVHRHRSTGRRRRDRAFAADRRVNRTRCRSRSPAETPSACARGWPQRDRRTARAVLPARADRHASRRLGGPSDRCGPVADQLPQSALDGRRHRQQPRHHRQRCSRRRRGTTVSLLSRH